MSAHGTLYTNNFARCSRAACGHSGRVEFFEGFEDDDDGDKCPMCGALAFPADCVGNFLSARGDEIKPGDKIVLVEMPDDPNPIAPGTKGAVRNVWPQPAMGFTQIDVEWNDGSKLMLSVPPDKVRKVED